MIQVGQTVDRYQVLSELGEGGMARVYAVRHRTLGSEHALKVLTLNSKDVLDRLVAEGRIQASLRHPNVVTVTDLVDVGGYPGLVMERVRGPSLEQLLISRRLTLGAWRDRHACTRHPGRCRRSPRHRTCSSRPQTGEHLDRPGRGPLDSEGCRFRVGARA